MLKKKPIAIDLFCGAGGMSLGFEQAGFHVHSAFDCERFNILTHERNFPRTRAYVADLSKLSGKCVREISRLGRRRIDVIFGGPPCQGFSVGGKRDLNDKRNRLVYDFARLVKQLQPRYFVMENVKGLMYVHAKPVLKSFIRRMKLAGYVVVEPIQVLNASDFGVPQRRLRTFVIGCQKGLPLPSYPTRSGCFDESGQEFFPLVKDAISDLPRIDSYPDLFSSDHFPHKLPSTTNTYALLMRGELVSYDDQLHREIESMTGLTGCLRTAHSKRIIKRFASTARGSAEPVSRYIRLAWDKVAPTIRAGTGADHGSHTAPRPIHPSRPRCITTREAARLHSFPDWFQFHGTRWHDFRQIGNSVPPILARAVAKKIIQQLTS
ncbi:MAG: DNA cytosine methyltransferase [Planctomycetes bacterium]|nr:DNA cytosine methyltransferase [Planctomycetota bacterium]